MQALATIIKRGSQFFIMSKDGKKQLDGPFGTKEEAVKRLGQIEFFKKKGSAMKPINTNTHFQNANQRKVDTTPKRGTLAGVADAKILDKNDHFPVATEDQARGSANRVVALREVPNWFNGTLDSLKGMVLGAVAVKHPKMQISVYSHLDMSRAAMTLKDVNPNGFNKKKVMEVETPSLAKEAKKKEKKKKESAPSVSYSSQLLSHFGDTRAVGAHLMDLLEKREKSLKEAKKLGSRLVKSGISGKEFEGLMGFLQEDILHELLRLGTKASSRKEAARALVLKRQKKNVTEATNPFREPSKPTDGKTKKKKKKG